MHIYAMTLEDNLKKILETGKDWQRVPVKDAPGVFVVKAPASRNRPASLMVEINPLGPDGTPSKRRGLILRRVDELKQFREIMSAERLERVLETVEKVNPRTQDVSEEFEV
jgi:hypothetical protein